MLPDMPELLIGQWQAGTRIRSVVEAFSDAVNAELEEPLEYLDIARSLESAVGPWLDAIASRLGVERPYTSEVGRSDRVGFDTAGQPLDTAPFRGDAVNDSLFPVPDAVFRRILCARAVTLFSQGTYGEFVTAVRKIDPEASVIDNYDMTMKVISAVAWQLELADPLGALPRPAGVKVTYADRSRLGYDSAGLPFDQGVFEVI